MYITFMENLNPNDTSLINAFADDVIFESSFRQRGVSSPVLLASASSWLSERKGEEEKRGLKTVNAFFSLAAKLTKHQDLNRELVVNQLLKAVVEMEEFIKNFYRVEMKAHTQKT